MLPENRDEAGGFLAGSDEVKVVVLAGLFTENGIVPQPPSSQTSTSAASSRSKIVEDLNRFLRGWAAYFRYGNSTVQFDAIIRHADTRLALWWPNATKHRRYGWKAFASRSDRFGLISLNGTIVAPRPNRPWRQGR